MRVLGVLRMRLGFTVRALFALQAFSRTMVALALVFFSFVELFVNRESIYVHVIGDIQQLLNMLGYFTRTPGTDSYGKRNTHVFCKGSSYDCCMVIPTYRSTENLLSC